MISIFQREFRPSTASNAKVAIAQFDTIRGLDKLSTKKYSSLQLCKTKLVPDSKSSRIHKIEQYSTVQFHGD